MEAVFEKNIIIIKGHICDIAVKLKQNLNKKS